MAFWELTPCRNTMDDDYYQILRKMQETDESMAANERMLAEYKQRLSHQYERNDYVIHNLKDEVAAVKASVDLYDSKMHQISSNNYNCLLKKIATIEQKINTRTQQQPPLQRQREPPCPLVSGGTDNVISTSSGRYSASERDSYLKTEIQLLKKELNTVHCMQERLLEQVDNLKETSSSKVENLELLQRYVRDNERLQSELIKQMDDKDNLMTNYAKVLSSFKSVNEQSSKNKHKYARLLEGYEILKVQKLLNENRQLKVKVEDVSQTNEYLTGKVSVLAERSRVNNQNITKEQEKRTLQLERYIRKLKIELTDKQSILTLMQRENDAHCEVEGHLAKYSNKLEKMKQKYTDVKHQLDQSLHCEDKIETLEAQIIILKRNHSIEMNSQLQTVTAAVDGLLVPFDTQYHEKLKINYPQFDGCSYHLQKLLDKISYLSEMLTCITVQKLKIEQDYQQTKEHTEILKKKLKDFQEDLFY